MEVKDKHIDWEISKIGPFVGAEEEPEDEDFFLQYAGGWHRYYVYARKRPNSNEPFRHIYTSGFHGFDTLNSDYDYGSRSIGVWAECDGEGDFSFLRGALYKWLKKKVEEVETDIEGPKPIIPR